MIASRLNIAPEHFSRILDELTETQLIEVTGRTVSILDMDKLRTYEG